MRSAERETRNDFAPRKLRKQGNELNAECGTRNAERPHSASLHSQGKVNITNYLDFVVWMLDATKVKPQRVAVLEVLRPEGVFLLTKYSAKMQSLTRREFTQEVNDRGRLLFCEV